MIKCIARDTHPRIILRLPTLIALLLAKKIFPLLREGSSRERPPRYLDIGFCFCSEDSREEFCFRSAVLSFDPSLTPY